jgi:flagellar basal body rod protein FlgG
VVEEMTDMLATLRLFETYQKMVDKNWEKLLAKEEATKNL